jgi:hypothetical protein
VLYHLIHLENVDIQGQKHTAVITRSKLSSEFDRSTPSASIHVTSTTLFLPSNSPRKCQYSGDRCSPSSSVQAVLNIRISNRSTPKCFHTRYFHYTAIFFTSSNSPLKNVDIQSEEKGTVSCTITWSRLSSSSELRPQKFPPKCFIQFHFTKFFFYHLIHLEKRWIFGDEEHNSPSIPGPSCLVISNPTERGTPKPERAWQPADNGPVPFVHASD